MSRFNPTIELSDVDDLVAENEALAARLAAAERIVRAVSLVHKEAKITGRVTLTEGAALFLGAQQYFDRHGTAASTASQPSHARGPSHNLYRCPQCGTLTAGKTGIERPTSTTVKDGKPLPNCPTCGLPRAADNGSGSVNG